MPPEALAKVRAQYPQYADIPDAELAHKIVTKYPQYQDLLGDVAAQRDPYLRGVPKEPGSPGPPEQVTGEGAPMSTLLTTAATAPLAMGGGALAARLGVPAVLGRVGAVGAAGAGRRMAEGQTGMEPVWGGLLDAIVAGLTEGVVSVTTGGGKIPLTNIKVGLKEWGAPSRAFEWATKAPRKAIDMVASRLPKTPVLNIPSMSAKPMTVDDAVAKLAKMTGAEYQIARAELASELSRLDIQKFIPTASGQFVKGPGPSAGSVFKKFTSPERFEPSGFANLAEGLREALSGPTGRSVADALATSPIAGIPAGALGLAAIAPSLVRHLPGGKQIVGEEEHRGGGF